MLKAINIKWDTDGNEKVLQELPTIEDNGVIIDCVGGKQIRLTIQVD